jgi:hypothetical protein
MSYLQFSNTVVEVDDGARLPLEVSFGARGTHGRFLTDVIITRNGRVDRNVVRSQGKGIWQIRKQIDTEAEREDVIDLLYTRFGRGTGFRMRDWTDYELIDEPLVQNFDAGGSPTPVVTELQLAKIYTKGGSQYVRKITRPVDPEVWTDEEFRNGDPPVFRLQRNGIRMDEGTGSPGDYTVDYSTGIVTLRDPLEDGDDITIEKALFHVPVILDTDDPDWEIAEKVGDDTFLHRWNLDLREVE